MVVMAVDDEAWALEELTSNLKKEQDVTVFSFNQSDEAIEWAKTHPFDAAFLDINMRGIGGLELAKQLREYNNTCYIVFCTGYSDYALDALTLHATGYLLKPILQEKLHGEIEYIKSFDGKSDKRIRVRCYGGFEVYDMKGNPLDFRRTRAKELLAILIDSNGMGLNSKEICARMFDEGESEEKNMNHLYKLVQELRRVLKEVGAEGVLKNSSGDYYVEMALIEQDETGKGTAEYMEQYHWN